jgi:hypothetical protein
VADSPAADSYGCRHQASSGAQAVALQVKAKSFGTIL